MGKRKFDGSEGARWRRLELMFRANGKGWWRVWVPGHESVINACSVKLALIAAEDFWG